MNRLVEKAYQSLVAILFTATVWLTLADALWAKSRNAPEPPEPPSFATGYIIILIMLGLGMAVICRPTFRRNDDEVVD